LQIPSEAQELSSLKFWFENDTLIHTLSSSIQFCEIEKYIDIEMKNKMKVRQLYYLINDFEFTRVKDIRSELLVEKKELKTDKEYKFGINDPELLKPLYKIGITNLEEIHNKNKLLFG
jgi:ATP-dependent Lon protease